MLLLSVLWVIDIWRFQFGMDLLKPHWCYTIHFLNCKYAYKFASLVNLITIEPDCMSVKLDKTVLLKLLQILFDRFGKISVAFCCVCVYLYFVLCGQN